MYNLYYDAEFTGLHRNTTFISMGMVNASCGTFYAEFTDYDKSQIDEWIQNNVINNLLYNNREDFLDIETCMSENNYEYYNFTCKGNKYYIRKYFEDWVSKFHYKNKLTVCMDCYAYDWMLLNDLLCNEGNAINCPSYMNYIPIDLSTYFRFAQIDPDIHREGFINTNYELENLKNLKPFCDMENPRHNSLWDAYVIMKCFNKISSNGSYKKYNKEE